TSCTASVSDASVTPQVPTGTLTWSSTSSGSFNAPTCTLVAASASVANCSVSYTPVVVGTHAISALYGGDAAHLSSSSQVGLTVTPAVVCSPRPAVQLSTVATGGGQLQVTVTVSGAGNQLRSIQFGTAANGLIDAGGMVGSPGNWT